jgi:hypothetical protein
MAVVQSPILAEQLTIVPAHEVSWDVLAAIFGTANPPSQCLCQRFKVIGWNWRDSTLEERTAMLRAQTGCGDLLRRPQGVSGSRRHVPGRQARHPLRSGARRLRRWRGIR